MTDAAPAMKTRLRADLRAAMKAGRASEARLIRALVAAIDNAEAPPLPDGQLATANVGSTMDRRRSYGFP